ncbi:O-antigen ligase family protein [Kouleothrix sp.]|uniref:O-antigen ligase family protein n=1 Tax=Kouleothrix sp. TaxID=2779161 RepID=UPI00391DD03F
MFWLFERAAPAVGPRVSPGWRGAIPVAQGLGLALGLGLCYFSDSAPLKVLGVALFGILALQRADLALLFVPLTAPWFLLQLRLPGLLPHAVPPHELALALTGAAAPIALLARPGELRRALARLRQPPRVEQWLRRYAPELLLLLAGIAGILFTAPQAVARQDALRAFRWFIAEPLAFVALTHWLGQASPARDGSAPIVHKLAAAFVSGGCAVALWALAQFAGMLIAPGAFQQNLGLDFSADVLGRLPRVASIYPNPNNLGLYMGRVWPLAAMLGMAAYRRRRGLGLVYGLGALLCLGGMLVSFSRGAWLGAGAALVVLLLPELKRRFRAWLLPVLLIGAGVLAGVAALMLGLRGGFAGGSVNVRLLLWREALALIERHPFGLGLDQFYYYHNPVFGNSLIDPALATTNDRNAHQPHTLLLELWLNLGPLGVCALALLLARAIFGARGALRGLALAAGPGAAAGQKPWVLEARLRVLGALAALTGALVHGLVDTFYFWPDLAISLWLLIMLVRYDTALATPPAAARPALDVARVWRPMAWAGGALPLRVGRRGAYPVEVAARSSAARNGARIPELPVCAGNVVPSARRGRRARKRLGEVV